MKKIWLFFLMLVPIIAKANEVNYKVPDFYIEAQIKTNGDMSVKELIVLSGTFNGNKTDLVYKNSSLPNWNYGNIDLENSSIYGADGLKVESVKAKYIDTKISFSSFSDNDYEVLTKTNSAYLGQKGVYTSEDTYDGKSFKMYYPANRQSVAFLLEYTLKNVVVIHNDVAEVFWPFLSSSFESDIENVKIKLLLPQFDNSDDFRIWAHGSLTGEVQKELNGQGEPVGLIATMKNFNQGEAIDIRLTFDKKLITLSDASKQSGIDAKDKIIANETVKAEEANEIREQARRNIFIIVVLHTVYFIGLVVFWIYIYKKYDREYKSSFNGEYYREFIEDYSVEVVDYLMKKQISPNAMSASIMNLIYKKNIKAEKIDEKNYIFTLLSRDNTSSNEGSLIDFLFEKVGSGETWTTKELKKYASGTHTYSKFTKNWTDWKNGVLKEAKAQKFYEEKIGIRVLGCLYAMLGLVSFIFPVSIAFLIYNLCWTKRTPKGNEDYRKWKAFKKFLIDFSLLKEREIPEVILWEKYMVYAVVLGVADKVSKAMNVKIKELDPNGVIYSPSFYPYLHLNLAHTVNSAVHNAITESISKAVASSSNSSGGGFGGGFSSGGGGGFGGGGHGGGGF